MPAGPVYVQLYGGCPAVPGEPCAPCPHDPAPKSTSPVVEMVTIRWVSVQRTPVIDAPFWPSVPAAPGDPVGPGDPAAPRGPHTGPASYSCASWRIRINRHET